MNNVEKKEKPMDRTDKFNNISLKHQVNNFLTKLNNTTSKKQRSKLLTQYNDLIVKMNKNQQDELLSIIGEKESEDYQQQFTQLKEIDIFVDKLTPQQQKEIQQKVKEYKQRKIKEEEQKKEIERVSKIEITDEVLDNAIKEAEASKLLTVKDDWLKLFNQISYQNTLCGEILFHVFLGQMTNHIVLFDKSGKRILMKIDFFWIQNSSSGKSEAIDNFFKLLIKEFEWHEKNEETKQSTAKQLLYSTYRGQSTLAGILNRYKRDKGGKGYTNDIIIGPLQKTDFWIWNEANDLLSPTTYNQKLIDALLDLMEGKEHVAYLEKYDKPVKTKGTGSLVAISRPVANVELYLIKSGLVNRCFTIMRSLKWEEMKEMIDINAVQSFGKVENKVDYEIERKMLIKKLKDIIEWSLKYKFKTYPQKNPDLLNKLMQKKLDEFMEDVKKEVNVKQYKESLGEYVGRMRNKAIALAYQNAIIRKSPVDVQDILNAFRLLSPCYKNLKYWMFENIHLRKEVTEKQYKLYYMMKAALKGTTTKSMKTKDLKKIIEKRKDLNISGHYVYEKIKEVVNTYNKEFEKEKNIIKLKEG